MVTKYVVNNLSGQTITGDITINGNLSVTGTSNTIPYKVYTALLTQSGSGNTTGISSGPLTKGITYKIQLGGGDFSNVGAPNNDAETYFVAINNDTPLSYGGTALIYNTGAPVATVLENTIGNIWFTYYAVGQYKINSNGLLPVNKRQFYYGLLKSSDVVNGFIIESDEAPYNDDFIQIITRDGSGAAGNGMTNTPIEIRVYN